MAFELLEALVKVRLTGMSAVEKRLDALKARLKSLSDSKVKVDASGGSTGGSAGRSVERLTRRFAILRETAREARSDLVNTLQRTKTQLRAFGDGPGVEKLTKELDRLRQRANIVKGEFAVIGGTSTGAKRSTSAFRELNDEIRDLERRLRALNQREGADTGLQRQVTLAKRLASAYRKDVSTSLQAVRRNVKRLNDIGLGRKLSDQARILTTQFNNLQSKVKDAIRDGDIEKAKRLAKEYAILRRRAKELARSASQIRPALSNSTFSLQRIANLGSGLSPLTGIFTRIASSVSRLTFRAVLGGLKALYSPLLFVARGIRNIVSYAPQIAVLFGGLAIRNLIKFQTQLDKINALMNFAFGSRSQDQLKFTTDLANELGLRALDLRSAFGNLSAAMRGSGVELEQQQKLFRGLSQAAVVLGRSQDEVRSIFLAIEQIGSKGRLSAEELRRQLGNVLPGAFGIAARALKISNAELDRALKAGEISASEFFTGFADQLQKEFAGKAAAASDLLQARLNRLQNRVDSVRESLSRFLGGRFVRLIEEMANSAEKLGVFRAIDKVAQNLAGGIDVLGEALKRAAPQFANEFRRILPDLKRVAAQFLVINARAVPALAAIGRVHLRVIANLLDRISGVLPRTTNFKVTGLTEAFAEATVLFTRFSDQISIAAAKLQIFAIQAKNAFAFKLPTKEDAARIAGLYLKIGLLQRGLNEDIESQIKSIVKQIENAKPNPAIGNEGTSIAEGLENGATAAAKKIRSQIFSNAEAFFNSLQISGEEQTRRDNTEAVRNNTRELNKLRQDLRGRSGAPAFSPVPVG